MPAIASHPLPRTGRAALWQTPTTLALREVAVPAPGPGELLVRVRASGICGSDLHRFRTQTPPPVVPGIGPGHELAGEVVALGPGVAAPPLGTRVAPMAAAVCGACRQCRRGRPFFCPQLQLAGETAPGGMADYIIIRAPFAYPIPDAMPWAVAALAEPCAASLHGLKRAGLVRGQRVLVLGAGTIGLLAVLAAYDAGATAVGVTARYPQQRTAARALGATDVYDPDAVGPGTPAATREWDIVVETVGGQAPTLQQAVDVVGPGGTVLLLGVHLGPQPLRSTPIWSGELTIVGALGYDTAGPRADFEEAITLLDRHRERVAPLTTHTFPLEAAAEAFATALDKRSGAIKVAVLP